MALQELTVEAVADPERTLPSWNARLWLSGQIAPAPRLAIVGARACSSRARRWSEAFVEAAGELGMAVVSGGARGVDAAVHRAALEREVPQNAFVPCFEDEPYPPEHAQLFRDISSAPRSGVVYALGPDAEPSRGLFLSRNRLVVGAATALVVVEAGLRSGSVATGRIALDQGRPVVAVLGSPGCAALVERGARPLSLPVDDPRLVLDALRELDRPPDSTQAEHAWPLSLREVAARVEGRSWLSADDFDDPYLGLLALVEAQAEGLILEVSPGRYYPAGSGDSRRS